MTTYEAIMQPIHTEFITPIEQKLRGILSGQNYEWLIEQIVQLALHKQRSQAVAYKEQQEIQNQLRQERLARVRALGLNLNVLNAFLQRYQAYDRECLLAKGYLLPSAPVKGTALIAEEERTPAGNALLQSAKDMLFGLLFGDCCTHTHFTRVERELLTLIVPRSKAETLSFMQASTELRAVGAWRDPDSVSHDERADNVLLEIEYGEVKDELIGDGIVRCLSLLNNLEVNEQILYARMINIEQSTLIA